MAETQHSREDVESAIRKARGNLTGAARSLGVERQSVHRYLTRWPTLKEVVREARTIRVEQAEDALDQAVERGEAWAVALTLKCLGKHLGYIERLPDVVAASNLEALRRLLSRLGVGELSEAALLEHVLQVQAEMEAER